MMLVLLANLRLWRGRAKAALPLATEARDLFQSIGDHYGKAMALAALSRSIAATGDAAEVEKTVEEVLSATNAIASEHMGAAIAGGAFVHLGDGDRALAVLFAAQTDVHDKLMLGDLESRVSSGLAYLQTAKVDEALVLIEDAAAQSPTSPYALSAFALVTAAIGEARRGDRRGRLGRLLSRCELPRPCHGGRSACARPRGEGRCPMATQHALTEAEAFVDATDDVLARRLTRLAGAEALAALGAEDADELRRTTQAELVALGAPARGLGDRVPARGARARRGRRRRLLTTGLIVGRFCPPHLGHSHLIESAAAQVDQLVVFVNTQRRRGGARRAARRRGSRSCTLT